MEAKPGQIYALIPAIMRDVESIGKDRTNAQQGYKFRGIDDVYNAMHEPLAKHGVFIVPQVVERWREEKTSKAGALLMYTTLKVSHRFYAPDGSSVEAVTVGEALDSGDKSTNKAMSAAMKYAILEVFAIPTQADNDTENNSHEIGAPAPQQPVAPPPPRPPTTPAPRAPAPAARPPQQPAATAGEDGGIRCKVVSALRKAHGTNTDGSTWEMFIVTTNKGEFKTFEPDLYEASASMIGADVVVWSTTKTKSGKTYEQLDQIKRA